MGDFWGYHDFRHWYRFGRGFGFGFRFHFPPGWFEPFEWFGLRPPKKEDYLRWLREYADDLRRELEEVEKEIKEWEK